jgi:hypothetical protein
MKVLVSIICLCMLCLCLSSLPAFSLSLTAPLAPTLDITCSSKATRIGRPPASVIFAWRVTNAQYVLIKGYDQERHPLIGEFNRPSGGIFTFIAVNGDEIVRKPCMCVLKSEPGMGPNLWRIEQDDEGVFSSRSEGSDIKLTTPLSRDKLKDLLIDLARTNYGVVLEPTYAAKENIFIVTKSYGVHKSLCEIDGCKKDGNRLIRQLGFDIVAQRDSQVGDKTRYEIHITGEVLSKPASGDGEWGFDANSTKIADLMSKKFAEDIINHDKPDD